MGTWLANRDRTGRAGRGDGLNAGNSGVSLRKTYIGFRVNSRRVPINPRVRGLCATGLEQSEPAIQASTPFLRAKDAWESAQTSNINSLGIRANTCRRSLWFLEREDIRRVDLRCNVNWLPDGGGRKRTRETRARLLGADGRLVRTRGKHRGNMSAWLAYGQGGPCFIFLINCAKSRGTECFNRSW